MKSRAISPHLVLSLPGHEPSLCPAYLACQPLSRPLSHQIYCRGITVLVFKWPLSYLIMAPKHRSNDAGNSDNAKETPQTSSFKWKGQSSPTWWGKEEKSSVEVAKIYGKNDSSIGETVKKEKEIHASLALKPQTAKVTATVHEKCLVKTEKALNLYNKIFWDRETTFT